MQRGGAGQDQARSRAARLQPDASNKIRGRDFLWRGLGCFVQLLWVLRVFCEVRKRATPRSHKRAYKAIAFRDVMLETSIDDLDDPAPLKEGPA